MQRPMSMGLSFLGYKIKDGARDESADGRDAVGPSPTPRPGLTVGWLLEVDISIAQRAAGGHVAAHADGQDGASRQELLVEHGLRYVGVQVAHVERGERKDWAAGVHGGRQRRENRAAGQHTPAHGARVCHRGGSSAATGAQRARGSPSQGRAPHPLPPSPPRAPITGAGAPPRCSPGSPSVF